MAKCNHSSLYDPSDMLKQCEKQELEKEIKHALDFLAWIEERISARSLDKDKTTLNLLAQTKQLHEEYVNTITNQYAEISKDSN